jgi:hypothetical protein
MDDPGGDILIVLQSGYAKFRSAHKEMTLPVPNALRRKMVDVIAKAKTKNAAFDAFAKHVGQLCWGQESKMENEFRAQLTTVAVASEGASTARAAELATAAKEKPPPAKRRRVGDELPEAPTFSAEEKAKVRAALAKPQMAVKLFHASNLGYDKHREQGREGVGVFALHNKLGDAGHLRTSDLARAQAGYQKSKTGDALELERRGKARVTMVRTGGQGIHQLGPYLPGGDSQSVQGLIEAILRTGKVGSRELAAAISMSSVDSVEKFLRAKGVPEKYVNKVRAMRHLLAVEKARGPEVATATSLEHRSAMHGFRHIGEYPRHTPLGPPKATTELRGARKRRREEIEAGEPEEVRVEDYSYIPAETRRRGLASITNFVTKFVESPQADPEATRFVNAILTEPETSGPPSEEMIEASADVLRTPNYNPWEEFEEEEETGGADTTMTS